MAQLLCAVKFCRARLGHMCQVDWHNCLVQINFYCSQASDRLSASVRRSLSLPAVHLQSSPRVHTHWAPSTECQQHLTLCMCRRSAVHERGSPLPAGAVLHSPGEAARSRGGSHRAPQVAQGAWGVPEAALHAGPSHTWRPCRLVPARQDQQVLQHLLQRLIFTCHQAVVCSCPASSAGAEE